MLDGKRAATHWMAAARLAAYRPAIAVDADAIFVRDGAIWTSAGVTTGIDMALAMVEEDHGRRLADAIAARLVLYARRPGSQAQFSEALLAQVHASDPLAPVIAWARGSLDAPLDVPTLARRAGTSIRTFHRRCATTLGTTPAKLVERLRLERARTLLATTDRTAKEIAALCGLRDGAQLARTFDRALGLSPTTYRALFGARAAEVSVCRKISEEVRKQ